MGHGTLRRGSLVGRSHSFGPGGRRRAAPAAGVALALLLLPAATPLAGQPAVPWLVLALALALLALALAFVQHRRATRRERALRRAQEKLGQARAEAMAEAVIDPLTELPNRRALVDAYHARQRPLAERDLVLSMMLVDVDGFDRVNDIAGADAADRLLQRLASVLSASVRRTDVVGRIGRDRFLLMLMSLRYGGVAKEIAARLYSRLAEENERHPGEPTLSVSIGSVNVGQPGTDFSTAVRKAELALAHCRAQGGGRAEPHRPALDSEHEQRCRFAAELAVPGSRAIVPLYRPRVGRERQIAGLRALPHWREHGDALQPLDPAVMAAELDLSAMLSERLLDAVIRDAAGLEGGLADGARLIVPVAAARLVQPGFPERLLDRLLEAGLSPRRFEVVPCGTLGPRPLQELTEPLRALSAAGVALSLDVECGIPVSELRCLPLDALSLGPRLIGEIVVDQKAQATAQALVQLAHAQGCAAIAEGTDTAAIERTVREMGCDFAEGDRYSRPLAFSSLVPLLKRGIAA